MPGPTMLYEFREGMFVTEAGEIFPAIERAFASGKPACVNVIIDQKPEGVTGGYEFLG